MKKCLLFLIMICSAANAAWYGTHDIDEWLTFAVTTSQFSTGAGIDATGSPAYAIYEDETGAEVVSGSMAKLDDAGSVGFYTERVELTDANFDAGKFYTIYITATVDGVAGTTSHAFKLRASPIATIVAAALTDINLDHLIMIAVDTDLNTTVHDNSVFGFLFSISDVAAYTRATDSMQAQQENPQAPPIID